jgi:hypothetical protein
MRHPWRMKQDLELPFVLGDRKLLESERVHCKFLFTEVFILCLCGYKIGCGVSCSEFIGG